MGGPVKMNRLAHYNTGTAQDLPHRDGRSAVNHLRRLEQAAKKDPGFNRL